MGVDTIKYLTCNSDAFRVTKVFNNRKSGAEHTLGIGVVIEKLCLLQSCIGTVIALQYDYSCEATMHERKCRLVPVVHR